LYPNQSKTISIMPTYSVETRNHLNDGDYIEECYDFDTKEEVKDFLENEMGEDETLHSILEYADGQTSNPKDITKSFRK